MKRRGRGPVLSEEDVVLWSHVARTVKPFPGRAAPVPPQPAEPAEPSAKPSTRGGPAAPVPPEPKPALAPLVPLERRTLTALKRGRQPLEGVLDLHGLRQAEAHDRLRAFLHGRQRGGARLVLVITGKGAAGVSDSGDERGVLKRVVPHWLRMADLRAVVLGFEDAALTHGGSGALYVRLRRLKEQGP